MITIIVKLIIVMMITLYWVSVSCQIQCGCFSHIPFNPHSKSISPILEMRKLRLQEDTWFTWGSTPSKCQSENLSSVCLAPEPMDSSLPRHLCWMWMGVSSRKNINACIIFLHSYMLINKHIKLSHMKLLIFSHLGPTKMAIACGLMQWFS